MSVDDHLRSLVERLDVTDGRVERLDVAASFAGLEARIAHESSSVAGHEPSMEAPKPRATPSVRRSRAMMPRWAMVAVGIALVLGGLGMHHLRSSPSTVARTYRTGNGQQATVTLPDGSVATLGPATQLTVAASRDGIDARMSGEALFHVRHHDRSTFTVRAGPLLTRVLGTTFVVRHYGSAATRVSVIEGRVAVHHPLGDSSFTRETILSAQMVGVATDSGDIRVIRGVPSEDMTGWVNRRLVFRDTPVRDVIAELGRTYDVNIQLVDTLLAAHQVTLAIPVGERSIDDALTLLTMTLDARYTRSGRVITIQAGRRPSRRPMTPHHPFSSESVYGR